MVRKSDLDEFNAALAERPANGATLPIRTPTQRRRGHEYATRQLEKMGV